MKEGRGSESGAKIRIKGEIIERVAAYRNTYSNWIFGEGSRRKFIIVCG
jgi:hypothetical protein